MFMTVKEAAEKWSISDRRVRILCAEGKIPGAYQQGRAWKIPAPELNDRMQSYRAYYDEINVYNPDENIHPKAAHQARNRDMVDRSDLVVFYVEHEYGGAWQTMKYAENQKKEIINLAMK